MFDLKTNLGMTSTEPPGLSENVLSLGLFYLDWRSSYSDQIYVQVVPSK